MHDHYQELCAAASIGQATPEELSTLEAHLAGCAVCRQAYSDFTNIAAYHYALEDRMPGTFLPKARDFPNLDLLRQQLLERASDERVDLPEASGLATNSGGSYPLLPKQALRGGNWKMFAQVLTATAILSISIFASYETGKRASIRRLPQAGTLSTVSTAAPANGVDASLRLGALNLRLENQIARLKRDLQKTTEQLAVTEMNLKFATNERQKLLAERVAQDSLITDLRKTLGETETMAATAKQEAVKLQDGARDAQATYVADQVKLRELTDQLEEKTAALERETELMQKDRDIRELMVARNLHIVDVFDTDTKGRTRSAFGRIFFTEGKSLVFYAYDLNEAKLQNAHYHYRVWGAKEGQDEKAKSLGIFYSDDQSQRRWVFRCNDPRVLSEIDSVFVTLESPGADPSHPKGPRLMDAYLRGVPNHP